MRKFSTLVCFFFFFLFFCSQPRRQPGEVRVRLVGDPETLNPVNYQNAGGLQIINLLFQSLLTVDLADEKLKPALAARLPAVERQDSVTLFTYQLRDEAEWTNGSPVTAADVAFTLKVLKAPLVNNEHLKPQVAFIKDIVLSGSKTFTLVCEGYTPEMELLTGDFFILPAYLLDPEELLTSFSLAELSGNQEKLAENKQLQQFAARFNNADFARNKDLLKGSGGYELEHWATGQYITLKRKENWWGKATGAASSYLTANPERISFQVIPDNTTALLALKNRQLDVLESIAAAEFDQLKQNESFKQDYALYTPTIYDYTFVGLNTRLPKLQDKHTRQAIAYLLDPDNLIKVTLNSYATRTVGPVPPTVQEFYHQELPLYSYNPGKAVKLLTTAGWAREKEGWFKNINGRREQLTLDVIFRAGNTVYENSALIFQQNASKIGIPVTVQAMENSLLNQKLKSQEYDMFFRSLSGNPFVFNFKPLFHTSFAHSGGSNYTGFGNAESDALLDAINTAGNNTEKAKLLKRLQEQLHEEAAIVSLYYQKGRIAVHRRFTNTKISGLKPHYDVSSFLIKD
ncbi:ABC transporter substrate-binding protein [Botryobacter ruber]|uniref:ABC transporter substrate-binding protein n=1 Tax=Botryobacter ruber TaxID=2171629 RepID=UPI001F0B9AB7|nr:ABC transporter substrate-binding protein [Botryobacter ruber]